MLVDHLVERFLHHLLSLGVEGRRCLIQEDERWLPDDGPGDGQSLLLAPTQLHAALARIGLELSREIVHKLPRVSLPERMLNVSIADAVALVRGQTVDDVLPYGRREQASGLRHHGHVPAQVVHVIVGDVLAVKQDGTPLRVVPALQEVERCALATTGASHKANLLTWGNRPAEVEQDLLQGLRGKCKVHVPELNGPHELFWLQLRL
mmetsp:Transcript_82597/g.246318  ORF Transcript_82597/g.246318 Transcript_82597/m.246318 type:complete len:207 (+) Transcript_82597:559-1179(+)